MSIINAGGLSRHTTNISKEFDHHIDLVDSTQQPGSARPSRPSSPPGPDSEATSSPSTGASTPVSGEPGPSISRKWTLREELARRKYSKWQESKFAGRGDGEPSQDVDGLDEEDGHHAAENRNELGESSEVADFAPGAAEPSKNPVRRIAEKMSRRAKPAPKKPRQTYEVDILYENQRGWFFCGIPLFSHNSLLNFDPFPWETANFKPSPVDITNAQPPDPSWEWVWKSWYVDMSPDVDEEGWQYSFSFSPSFSWHGTHVWFHAFVRRRRWLRKRAKRRRARGLGDFGAEDKLREGHMLNSDYFTIHPHRDRSPTSSLGTGGPRSSIVRASQGEDEEEEEIRDLRDIGSLMKAIKTGRIDREKIDAVENFIHQGGEEIYYLTERMPEIMSTFIFQASRRQLLARLVHHYNETSETSDPVSAAPEDGDKEQDTSKRDERARMVQNLQRAIRAAEDQVKTLEYWSDVKHLAKQGDTISAADASRGWTGEWQGLDQSGPADLDAGDPLPIGESELEPKEKSSDKGKGRE